jgi:hypothetical protein
MNANIDPTKGFGMPKASITPNGIADVMKENSNIIILITDLLVKNEPLARCPQ